ncbi:cohesin domain-containing protein [Novipirellula sp.]|uniref:cohesin domain-containing protein n=1 Tax=Novipirellula sp. TaxID=2795430 RepID=UPI003569D170
MATKACKLGVQQLESRRLLASVSMPSAIVDSVPEISAAVEVSTPVEVSGAQGVRAAEVRIQFDPAEVTTDATRIQAGSVWNGRGTVIANVDEHAGTIVAFVYSTKPVAHDEGGLIDIGFAVKQDRPSPKPIEIDLQQVRLNEGQISLAEPPIVGADASDGKIRARASENVTHVTRVDERSSESWANHWGGRPLIHDEPCPWPGGLQVEVVSPQAYVPVSLVGRSDFSRPGSASRFAARAIDSIAPPTALPYGPLQPHVVDQAFADSGLAGQ